MKVCLLNDSFPPVIDGVVNVVMNYANYLIQDHGGRGDRGTPRYPDADYSQYPYRVVPYPSLDTTAVTSGYRTGNPFAGKGRGGAGGLRAGHHPHPLPGLRHDHGAAPAGGDRAPVVFTYHTKYDIDIRGREEARLAEGIIRAMVGNIEACDEVWVVSRGAGESLKSLGFQGDYRVMNNGVDFARGRVDLTVEKVTAGYDLPAGVPVLLFVGRMMTYKGLPLILDALKLLADAGQDFRMVFIGKGPDKELMEEKARSLG